MVKRLAKYLPGLLGDPHHLRCFDSVRGKRLFAQHVLTRLKRCDCPFGVQVHREWVVDNVNIVSLNELLIGAAHFANTVLGGKGFRPPAVSRGHSCYDRRIHLFNRDDQRLRSDPRRTQDSKPKLCHANTIAHPPREVPRAKSRILLSLGVLCGCRSLAPPGTAGDGAVVPAS